jgi:molecular chaperone GrpE
MKKGKDKNEENEMKQENTDNLTSQNEVQIPQSENSTEEELVVEENKQENLNETQEQKVEPNYEILVAEWKDKYIRLSAEFDNYRKRTLKEKIDLTKYAGEDLLKSILPVVDDFERGLKTIDQAKDMEAVKEGILLIYNKFSEFLKQKGIKEIETKDSEFNTDFHEAITKIPVEDKSLSGKIVDVVQKGYMLDEKIIRHSKVVVGE